MYAIGSVTLEKLDQYTPLKEVLYPLSVNPYPTSLQP